MKKMTIDLETSFTPSFNADFFIPLGTKVEEYPKNSAESVEYKGFGARVGYQFFELTSQKLFMNTAIEAGGGRLIPTVFNDTSSFAGEPLKEYPLTFYDVALPIQVGLKLGERSQISGGVAFTGSLYRVTPENTNGAKDRYDVYENSLDQGGIPVAGRGDHLHPDSGVEFGVSPQVKVSTELLWQTSLALALRFNNRPMDTNLGTVHLKSKDLSVGLRKDF
jgi:hypothetical protein